MTFKLRFVQSKDELRFLKKAQSAEGKPIPLRKARPPWVFHPSRSQAKNQGRDPEFFLPYRGRRGLTPIFLQGRDAPLKTDWYEGSNGGKFFPWVWWPTGKIYWGERTPWSTKNEHEILRTSLWSKGRAGKILELDVEKWSCEIFRNQVIYWTRIDSWVTPQN